jgi:hypothetical protein
MAYNITTTDNSEKRINLVYDSKTDTYKAFDIQTLDKGGSTISNSLVSGSNGTVLYNNQNREELFIQNLATGVLYVKYGSNADIGSFNFILASSSATNAGDGGSLNDLNYTGIVSVSGLSGVNSPRYTAWERS